MIATRGDNKIVAGASVGVRGVREYWTVIVGFELQLSLVRFECGTLKKVQAQDLHIAAFFMLDV